MSTSLTATSVRASALAALLERYPRLPRHAVVALPELAGRQSEVIERALDYAIERNWIEERDGELVVLATTRPTA